MARARADAGNGPANVLTTGTYTANDIKLFMHELFESRFEGIWGTNYRAAHEAAIRAGWLWEAGE